MIQNLLASINIEGKLQRSHRVLEKVNAGIVIYEVDRDASDFIFSYLNKAVEEIEAINKNDVIGRKVTEIFPGVKKFGLFDVFSRVWKSGEPEHHPTAFYEDGRISGWRDNHVNKLSSNEIIVVYIDHTNRKEDDRSEREPEYFYQTVFDTIQDGITVLDTELNIVKLNQAMERWYSPQKPFLGKKCHEVYHRRKTTCEDCPAKTAIESGTPQTKIVPRGGPVGTPGWIELSAFPIITKEGNTIGAVEYVRNITARKTAEEDLRNSEQQLKEIINFLPDPTWVIDKQGKIIYWNHALERLTKRNSSEMLGKGNYEYAVPFFGKRKPLLINLALKPDTKIEGPYTYLDKEGQILTNPEGFYPLLGENGLYLSATASPLYDSSGNIVGAIEAVRDITEQKLATIEKEKIVKKELHKALSNVKLLSGLLPICSLCKKIRDDRGYWNQLEEYIHTHSEATFSHGMCPECECKFYGNEDWYIQLIKNREK
ncbi:PAS domain-containing protein [Desulfogranum marinum]|uniref:PAS domain-containing protein n=1 Tax=Desulfogranum marinum TaxID=453220 RepID=UPI001962D3AB|nr:PAS domain-containing protein [Desulfogranum marinum]MBM9515236.1 PAS domain-containing protein [Desulfogranum marinum]